MHAFALRPEEREEFDGVRVSPAEPMGSVGIELRGFAGGQDDVVFTEAETELSLEHVDPLVALMRTQVREAAVASRREQVLECLQAATGPAAQRQDRHSVACHGLDVDPRVAGGRCAHQVIERYPVRPREGKQLFERGTPLTGLEA